MDAHQFVAYRASPADIAYSSKIESRNSPNSHFSTDFDYENLLGNRRDYYIPTENISCNSLESSSLCQRSIPPFDQESSLCCSSGSYNINRALQALETELMGTDELEEVTSPNSSRPQTQSYVTRYGNSGDEVLKRRKSMEEERSLADHPLKGLLMQCARALAENEINSFEKLIEEAKCAVSISGDPIQRLGAYMVEGLIAKKEESGSNIYMSLRCREPEGRDLLSYMHVIYEICPYLKFGYMAANGAIAEACRNENRIHIIDYQIAQGLQWVTLLQALGARPGGAPSVKITAIDDPVSKYARGEGLDVIGKHLSEVSDKFNIPFEFHPLPVYASVVTKRMLDVRPGEAIVVNFPLQLHHMPDESVDVNNPRDTLLRMVKSLSPKVVTLVEQESNTNTSPFLPRFEETLNFYSAMFESIDVKLGRDRKERIRAEQHCLARDIVNIIACEGRERVERHELLGKWKSRFMMAGFTQFPLSSYVNSVIGELLRCYSENYTLVEKDGALLLGWKERNLISASAWY